MQVNGDESGWLLYHSVGRYPGQRDAMAAALTSVADSWCALDDGRWAALDHGRARFLSGIERLIGAPPGTVFAAENVTAAFAAFVDSLPTAMLAGKRVLIAQDCFPSLHYLLAGLATRIGFSLVTVAPAAGEVSVRDEDLLAAWDGRVALAVLTWVTSTASRRADLPLLMAHGRRMGSLVAIDATQGLGIVPLDVATLDPDFAASTSLKWLCGVPGAGFGYVRAGLLPQTSPRLRGWFSKPDPFDWSLDSFSPASDARRFDTGTPSYIPSIGAAPGLEWLLATGIPTLRAKNLAISADLIGVAQAHGIQIASPLDPDLRGGSVMLELPAHMPAAEMVGALARAGLFADNRSQRLRLSPGPSTGTDVAARLDRVLAAWPRA